MSREALAALGWISYNETNNAVLPTLWTTEWSSPPLE
jgi:hypothetical protein